MRDSLTGVRNLRRTRLESCDDTFYRITTRREVPTRGAVITVHTFAHTIPNHHALGHRHPSLSELDGDQS